MKSPYLTPGEARAKLGISRRTLARRVEAGELAGVRVARGVVRFEASAFEASAPEADPTELLKPGPALFPAMRSFTPEELAAWLRVRPRLLRELARRGELPRSPRLSAGQISKWLNDHALDAKRWTND